MVSEKENAEFTAVYSLSLGWGLTLIKKKKQKQALRLYLAKSCFPPMHLAISICKDTSGLPKAKAKPKNN
jgi:hypothetical protein